MIRFNYIFFVVISFGFLSCSQLAFWKTVPDEEIKAAEEYLFRSIDTLLAIDPAAEPERYVESRGKFENALQNYLELTGADDRKLVHLDYRGTNVIIPVRSVEHFDDQFELIQTPGARIMWQRVGPVFYDEVVDIKAIQKEEGPVKIAVAFSDSLILFSPFGSNTELFNLKIPQEYKRNVRAREPNALIDISGENIFYTTVHADTTLLYNLNENTHTLIAAPHRLDIKPVTGRPYFSKPNGSEYQYIFSIRQYSDADRVIILDERGIPQIISYDDDSVLWKSDRPWGNRLFLFDERSIAITHPDEKLFSYFEISGDSVIERGSSPKFHGRVGAVTRVTIAGRDGYLAGIISGSKSRNNFYTQLYFIPEKLMVWHETDDIPVPLFPDYDSQFIVADNISRIIDAGYIRGGKPPFVHHNVYETVVKRGDDDRVINNLAESVSHDLLYERWTIRLREGIRFSDGEPLDAQAVKDSWLKNIGLCDDHFCTVSWVTEEIDDISVLDNRTLHVVLKISRPNFIEHLTAACFQVNKVSGHGRWALGTGPYKIAEHTSDRVLFDRNPYYHGGKAAMKEIRVIDQPADIIDYVTARRNAGATVRHSRELDFFGAIETLKTQKAGDQILYFLALNPGSPALRSVSARARIVATFERQAVLTVVTEARSVIASNFFVGENTHIEQNPPGAASGISGSLRIIYHGRDPVAGQIAQRLSVRLQQEGISAHRPEGVSFERLKQIRRNGQYDILVDSHTPFFASPAYNMFNLLYNGYLFDEKLTQMSEGLLVTDDDAEVKEIENYLAMNYFLYPLIRTSIYVVVPRRVHDIDFRRGVWLDFSRTWIPH